MQIVLALTNTGTKLYIPLSKITISDVGEDVYNGTEFDEYRYTIFFDDQKYNIDKIDYEKLMSAIISIETDNKLIMIKLKEEVF